MICYFFGLGVWGKHQSSDQVACLSMFVHGCQKDSRLDLAGRPEGIWLIGEQGFQEPCIVHPRMTWVEDLRCK